MRVNQQTDEILHTDRLSLRQLRPQDAAFIVELLNDPAFLRNIGDRGVRTLDDAKQYLSAGPLASYAQFGFGLSRVSLLADDSAIGLCGLLKRPALDDVDLGFAFLPAWRRQGYAFEISAALLAQSRRRFGLERVVAIVNPDNASSIRLLLQLGFAFEQQITVPWQSEPLSRYGRAT